MQNLSAHTDKSRRRARRGKCTRAIADTILYRAIHKYGKPWRDGPLERAAVRTYINKGRLTGFPGKFPPDPELIDYIADRINFNHPDGKPQNCSACGARRDDLTQLENREWYCIPCAWSQPADSPLRAMHEVLASERGR